MRTKITDNWEVELTNDRGDILTLKGEWYADFFKEYDNKQLIMANVVLQSEQLRAFKKFLQSEYHLPVSNRMLNEFEQKQTS